MEYAYPGYLSNLVLHIINGWYTNLSRLVSAKRISVEKSILKLVSTAILPRESKSDCHMPGLLLSAVNASVLPSATSMVQNNSWQKWADAQNEATTSFTMLSSFHARKSMTLVSVDWGIFKGPAEATDQSMIRRENETSEQIEEPEARNMDPTSYEMSQKYRHIPASKEKYWRERSPWMSFL